MDPMGTNIYSDCTSRQPVPGPRSQAPTSHVLQLSVRPQASLALGLVYPGELNNPLSEDSKQYIAQRTSPISQAVAHNLTISPVGSELLNYLRL